MGEKREAWAVRLGQREALVKKLFELFLQVEGDYIARFAQVARRGEVTESARATIARAALSQMLSVGYYFSENLDRFCNRVRAEIKAFSRVPEEGKMLYWDLFLKSLNMWLA